MDYREANILAQTFGFAIGTALSALLLVWSIALAERTGVPASYSQPASLSQTVRACSRILPCSSSRI